MLTGVTPLGSRGQANETNHVSILEQQFKYNKEKDLLKHEKQLTIEKAAQQKTQLISISVIGILLIVCVFSLWLFFKFKETEKQKNIISEQNIVVQKQKHLVDEKQKEIQDSIKYAKRIQDSFLASDKEFKQNLNDYFILFKPKDVVSGDFYWANNVDGKLYLCVADSTGHGIPGAFMSLLNISLLNEALLSKKTYSTSALLDFVRKILILGLKADEFGHGGNDGMDCVMISIDFKTLELEYTGANNPLWIFRDGAMIELKANKMPVGRSPHSETPFTSQRYSLQKNDILYLFTDGYPDQFGGPKGKKFKYKQLEELLMYISNETMRTQHEKLDAELNTWKGNLEQVDDICVIGVRI